MDNQRNLILAIVLSAVLLFGFDFLMGKLYPQLETDGQPVAAAPLDDSAPAASDAPPPTHVRDGGLTSPADIEAERASLALDLSSRQLVEVAAHVAGERLHVHEGGDGERRIVPNGEIIDVVSADEGAFSTERAGGVPIYQAARIAREEGADALYAYEIGEGGFTSYLGTNDAREVERMAANGDEEACLVIDAMGYQVAKAIAGLATVVNGNVRAIILTGGMSHMKRLTDAINERVSFIAPVFLMPGELEMEALATGAYRVMRGKESAEVLGDRYVGLLG